MSEPVNRAGIHRPTGWTARAWQLREKAVRVVARSGHPDAAALLVEALRDVSWKVRLAAAEELRAYPDPATVAPLLTACDDVDGEVAAAARKTLGLTAPPAELPVTEIVRLCRSQDPRARVAGAHCAVMSHRSDPELVGVLADCVLDAELPEPLRSSALTCLSSLDSPAAAEALLRIASRAPRQIQVAALSALRRTRKYVPVESLRPLCENPDPTIARLAVECAGAVSGLQAGEIVEWALRSPHASVRIGAYSALLYYDRPAYATKVWDAVRDPDEAVRAGFAESVPWGAPRETCLALASLLSDSVPYVRLCAVQALARLGQVASLGLLAECVRSPDEDVADTARQALEEQGGATQIARAVLANSAASPYDRGRAILQLASVGGFEPSRLLRDLEAEPGSDLMREAQRVMDAIVEMRTLLRSPDPSAISDALSVELLRRPTSGPVNEETLLRPTLPEWVRTDEELIGKEDQTGGLGDIWRRLFGG